MDGILILTAEVARNKQKAKTTETTGFETPVSGSFSRNVEYRKTSWKKARWRCP